MWLLGERRRNKRYKVYWDASLRCVFPKFEERLPVKLMEISLGGARLSLERLQVGPYHLMVGDTATRFELMIPLSEETITIPIRIQWYNQEDEEHQFTAGVEFCGIEGNCRAALKRAIKEL